MEVIQQQSGRGRAKNMGLVRFRIGAGLRLSISNDRCAVQRFTAEAFWAQKERR